MGEDVTVGTDNNSKNNNGCMGTIKSVDDIYKSTDDFQSIVDYTRGKGKCIYHGANQVYPGDEKRLNSSLYRLYANRSWIEHTRRHTWSKNFQPCDAERDIVEKFKNDLPEYRNKSNITILSDLRHLGADVNVIDFTYNFYIGLFFACHGDILDKEQKIQNKDGEIYVFNLQQVKEEQEIDYKDIDKYPELFYINPIPTIQNNARTQIQRSVFIYHKEGYVPLNNKHKYDIVHWTIDKNIKRDILAHLKQHHNIDQSTVYSDIVGFIANKGNFETSRAHFDEGQIKIWGYQSPIKLIPTGWTKKEWDDYLKSAIADFDEAIRFNRNYFDAYILRGYAKTVLREYSGALDDYLEAVKIDQKNSSAYHNLGMAYFNNNDSNKAEDNLKKAIDCAVELPESSNAYISRAFVRSFFNRHEEAIDDLNIVIANDPKNLKAYMLLGDIQRALRQHDKAFISYTKAIDLNPRNIAFEHDASISLQEYLYTLTDYSAALRKRGELNRLLGRREMRLASRTNQYDQHIQQSQKYLEEAINDCSKAIRAQPAISYPYIALAFAYCRMGDCQKNREVKDKYYQYAIQECEKALKKKPYYSSIENFVRWLQQQLKQQTKTDGEHLTKG